MMASTLSEDNAKDKALTHKVANLAHMHNEILSPLLQCAVSVERPGHINKAHVLHRDSDASSVRN